MDVLNINECSINDLCKLKGIGIVMASKIIIERNKKLFESKQDLIKRVKGITFNMLDNKNKGLYILFIYLQLYFSIIIMIILISLHVMNNT